MDKLTLSAEEVPMALRVRCPKCQTDLTLANLPAGQAVRCGQCGQAIRVKVPAAADIPSAPPAATKPPRPAPPPLPPPAGVASRPSPPPLVRPRRLGAGQSEPRRRGGTSPLVWVLAGAGVLFVLLLGLGGVTVAYFLSAK